MSGEAAGEILTERRLGNSRCHRGNFQGQEGNTYGKGKGLLLKQEKKTRGGAGAGVFDSCYGLGGVCVGVEGKKPDKGLLETFQVYLMRSDMVAGGKSWKVSGVERDKNVVSQDVRTP